MPTSMKPQGSCNSAKSEWSALDFHIFPWIRKHVWNPHGFSEVVILDLDLEALNCSLDRQCGKGIPGRGNNVYTCGVRVAWCICKLSTVNWASAPTSPSRWVTRVCLMTWFHWNLQAGFLALILFSGYLSWVWGEEKEFDFWRTIFA